MHTVQQQWVAKMFGNRLLDLGQHLGYARYKPPRDTQFFVLSHNICLVPCLATDYTPLILIKQLIWSYRPANTYFYNGHRVCSSMLSPDTFFLLYYTVPNASFLDYNVFLNVVLGWVL